MKEYKSWLACGLATALAASLAPNSRGDRAPSPTGAQSAPAHASHQHQSMRQMPRLQPKRVLTVTGREDWDALRGFGKDAPMVEMMTLMMVGGSGMEHMKMAPMERVATAGKRHADAGTEEPPSPRVPAGVRAPSLPNSVSVVATVSPNPPVVGDSTLRLTLTNARGKPLAGAKLAASLAMTSMNMGTTRPALKEGPPGQYTTTLPFSMAGPWRVTLTVTPADGPPFTRSFDFNVKP